MRFLWSQLACCKTLIDFFMMNKLRGLAENYPLKNVPLFWRQNINRIGTYKIRLDNIRLKYVCLVLCHKFRVNVILNWKIICLLLCHKLRDNLMPNNTILNHNIYSNVPEKPFPATPLLELRVWIPLRAWMVVSYVFCR